MHENDRWQLTATSASLVRPRPETRPVRFDALPQRLTIDAARTALLVIDMQNDFCHERGWLAGIGVDIAPARAAIPRAVELVKAARVSQVPVIWVDWGTRPDGADLPPGVRHVYDPTGVGAGIGSTSNPAATPVLQSGSWSAAIVDELQAVQEPGDIVIEKSRMSGFPVTALDAVLRRLRVDTLLFAGVNSDQCVAATLVDAANLGYDVVLVDGAAATTSPAFCHEATLYNVRQCFGFTAVWSDVCRALESENR